VPDGGAVVPADDLAVLEAEAGVLGQAFHRQKSVPSAVMPQDDPVAMWIYLDLLTRKVIGHRMTYGPSPESDEELDKLIVLRAWTARRMVN
jgi:hypothetical protein